jgi:predicted DNA-binding ribbon-helix-helix protein
LALEPEFWDALQAIAMLRGKSLPGLIAGVMDQNRDAASLASALRVFALEHAPRPLR